MNTIVWMLKNQLGNRDVLALHGDTVLYFVPYVQGELDVWQYRPKGGLSAACDFLVQLTARWEEHDGGYLAAGPTEFDLSVEAIATIHGSDPARYMYSPLLRKELQTAAELQTALPTVFTMAGLTPPPRNPDPGDMIFDPDTHETSMWDGASWVSLTRA